MKRFVIYVAWFFAFFIAAVTIDSFIFPVESGHPGYVDDYEAGAAKGEKHAPFILIGALVLTVVGMRSGKLPGAKRNAEAGTKEK